MASTNNHNLPDLSKYLVTNKCIRLTCDGTERFNGEIGYVGEVKEDSFEFGLVTNSYEHFSNISDPPILKFNWIKYSDVRSIRE